MQNNNFKVFDFIKARKIWIIVYAIILVAAIAMVAIFGVNLSIDFKGGTVLNYSFTGDIDLEKAEAAINEVVKQDVAVSENSNYATNEKSLVITLPKVENKLSSTVKDEVLKTLTANLKDNEITASSDSDATDNTLVYSFKGSIKETKTIQEKLEEALKLKGVAVNQETDTHSLYVKVPTATESEVIKTLLEKYKNNKLNLVTNSGAEDGVYFTFATEPKDLDKVKEELEKKLDVTGITLTPDTTNKVLGVVIPSAIENSITSKLVKAFPDSNIKNIGSNTVSGTIANNFFVKCLVAVLLAGILVVLYVGIRFRKIGGFSAGMFALLALLLDCFIAFSASVFFRLEIDSNFMSVILTTLGYSLNDTIVVYDRIRENARLYPEMELGERINTSITQSLGRTIKTTVATFLAIIAIVVVAEFFGLSTLRSFAIPMSVGILSGCITSVFISSPLWYSWRKFADSRKSK